MKTQPDSTPEPVALIRFKAVNFVEEQLRKGVLLAEALRQASVCPWPDQNGRCYAVRTIEDWWYSYQKGGFKALDQKGRADSGSSKAIEGTLGQWLIEQVSQHPQIPVSVLYAHWMEQGKKLPALRSVYRYLHRHGYDRSRLRSGRLESGPTKAFEVPHVNELWMVDFSPGPKIRTLEGVLTTHLCVLIDDCSRLIPFAAYYQRANTEAFHHTLKEALQRRGLPRKLYTDQGGPFVNQHTQIVCANLGIRLLHAKPYHSWSKGKIERVIQTIQQGFESTLYLAGQQANSLQMLNEKLSKWIQTGYHQRVHSAIHCSPESRYQEQLASLRNLEAQPEELERLFFTRADRTVRKDGTVRIDGVLYEVDLSLRTLRVQLRFDPFTLARIEVWHRDRFVGLTTRANLHLNSDLEGGLSYEKQ
jgi:putative transposase